MDEKEEEEEEEEEGVSPPCCRRIMANSEINLTAVYDPSSTLRSDGWMIGEMDRCWIDEWMDGWIFQWMDNG